MRKFTMNKNFNLKELLISVFNNQSLVVCLWCFYSVIFMYPFLPQNSSIQLSTFLMKLGIGCHLIVLLEIVGKSLFILQEQKGEKEGRRSSFKTTYLLVNSIIILGKYILPIISSIIGGVVILSNKTETPFIRDLIFLMILIFIMVTSLYLFLTTFLKK